MATTAQPAHARSRPLAGTHLIDLWHLLSLDAPTVAVLWTWFLAAANHIRLPLTATLAMAVAVWTLYAADRLLDARLLDEPQAEHSAPPPADLEPRHLFHHRHRRAFRTGIVAASLALTFLLPQLAAACIRLYLILGALLFGYFILIHLPAGQAPASSTQTLSRRLPKELAVGVFFSAATFIPTVARDPALRPILLPAALLFALLCSLNCLFIYAWEHPQTHPHPLPSYSKGSPAPHPATHLALRFLNPLAATVVLGSILLVIAGLIQPQPLLPWPIPIATALASLLLLFCDRNRNRLAPTTLRAAADLCLLTPLLFLPFLHV